MKRTSIRVKVLIALSACLLVGVVGTMVLMHYSFESNARALATESVSRSARLFGILEAREISKMTAVSAAIRVFGHSASNNKGRRRSTSRQEMCTA